MENPLVRDDSLLLGLSDDNDVPQSWNLAATRQTRLIAFLSFALNYQFHQLDPSAYRLTNVLIHVLNSMMIYALVITILKKCAIESSVPGRHAEIVAMSSSALFAVHPMATTAVTCISQRFASLAALFFPLSLVCYARARLGKPSARRKVLYAFALLSAALTMKTKENAFALPLLQERGHAPSPFVLWSPLVLHSPFCGVEHHSAF
jgi:hypothetical protein